MNRCICESCNKTFNKPEKTNKFLKICGLIALYGIISYIFAWMLSDNTALLGVSFLLQCLLLVIAVVHIIVAICKDNSRGKCPHCGTTNFISINSVKGQSLLNEIEKIKKQTSTKKAK